MLRLRLVATLAAASLVATAFAACSASNGEAIPSTVYDASPLDAGGNMPPPDAKPDEEDGDVPDPDGSKPDAPNDAKTDAPPASDVRIGEVYVDNALLGDGAEFVELRGAPGTAVDDLRLRLVDRLGTVKYDVAVANPGEKFPANGLWVVGGSQVFKLNVPNHVDHEVSVNNWGMDNDAGSVQLVRGTTLVDVVGYARDADAGALAPAGTAPTATFETKPAVVPDNAGVAANQPKKSFGRKTLAVDSNDNRADFCKMTATPGFDQLPCE